METCREKLCIEGTIQGVGFRPFVLRLAVKHSLTGFVKNTPQGVTIEAEGENSSLKQFVADLKCSFSLTTRLSSITISPMTVQYDRDFHIAQSENVGDRSFVLAPDLSICSHCCKELFDRHNRRHRFPFITCTQCGPRHSIVTTVPYDRSSTTMTAFTMCPECVREYEALTDRRFHSQTNACPACGPRLSLLDRHGKVMTCPDPFAYLAEQIMQSKIVAIKGIGGFHYVCNAHDDQAVTLLRERKRRPAKPFALMDISMERIRSYSHVSPFAAELLHSPKRPIVILKKRHGGAISTQVAPDNPYLGVMLAYAPAYYLLLAELKVPIVATSANLSDTPILYDDQEALPHLVQVADYVLTHNRPIVCPSDDSLVRPSPQGRTILIRRSRGFVPEALKAPSQIDVPILALGGHSKSVFAIGVKEKIFLSQHLGDLSNMEALSTFEKTILDYQRLLNISPHTLVHDRHPDYATTQYAQARARNEPIRTVEVQHHHAHMASCMVDNGLTDPVIGVILDGTGYGEDGTVWGGEFLLGDFLSYQRVAHFRPIPMPGGEAAIREPWRMAVAALLDAGQDPSSVSTIRDYAGQYLAMITKIANPSLSILTSSAGRLFDAVSAILGIGPVNRYDGDAAMGLEWAATSKLFAPQESSSYSFEIAESENEALQLDTRGLIQGVYADQKDRRPSGFIARRFHMSLACAIGEICTRVHQKYGIDKIVLSGGVFQNHLLLNDVMEQLKQRNFIVYSHQNLPPNDGGLCVGQLAIANATLQCSNKGERRPCV